MSGGEDHDAATLERWYEPRLDVLRFVAFLLVFASHNLDVSTFAPVGLRERLPHGVQLGLVLFFVLSAFLLTRLMQAELDRGGRVDVRAYIRRRVRRIWPLYFAVLGAAIVATLALSAAPAIADAVGVRHDNVLALTEVPFFATFVANWYLPIVESTSNFLPHLWSLSVEEQFYVLLPAIFIVSRRRPEVLGVVAIVGCAVTLALSFSDVSSRGVTSATTTYFVSFAAGMALAHWEGGVRARLSSVAAWRLTLVAAAVIVVAGPIGIPGLDGWLGRSEKVVTVTLATAVAAAGIALTLTARRPMGAVQRGMGWLGKRGYGLYVFHWPVLQVLVQAPLFARADRINPAGVVLSFVVTVAISVASYRWFEVRFLGWRRAARVA